MLFPKDGEGTETLPKGDAVTPLGGDQGPTSGQDGSDQAAAASPALPVLGFILRGT